MKKSPLKKFLAFKKWVKNIQTAGYNGTHTELMAATILQHENYVLPIELFRPGMPHLLVICRVDTHTFLSNKGAYLNKHYSY